MLCRVERRHFASRRRVHDGHIEVRRAAVLHGAEVGHESGSEEGNMAASPSVVDLDRLTVARHRRSESRDDYSRHVVVALRLDRGVR